MSSLSSVPPEPTLTRRVVTKPDGRRLIFYDFEPADANQPPASPPGESARHVGTSVEPAAG
ncbi:MAG: hypothetical protein NZ585_04840 [Chloracidobacterium sp.]|nr:hypothetical protein [Chloracidobacterium sp.]MDW8216810.1 hypothetical protein [Acidobacteriota bacterium]